MTASNDFASAFVDKVYDYYSQHKRTFDWRTTCDPYKILVSEFMLQQTQTSRVIDKYKTFLKEFPTIESLAKAQLSQVLRHWQGLGYNRRARFLHETTKEVVFKHNGLVPQDIETLQQLPGIGPYTARAISIFAFNKPHIMIETNIRTVFIHHFFEDQSDISDKELEPYIEQTLDKDNPREWYYALMDYGVQLKASNTNPSRRSKHHQKQSKFEGSVRQVRGAIIRKLTEEPTSYNVLQEELGFENEMLQKAINGLLQEGMIKEHLQKYQLPD